MGIRCFIMRQFLFIIIMADSGINGIGRVLRSADNFRTNLFDFCGIAVGNFL